MHLCMYVRMYVCMYVSLSNFQLWMPSEQPSGVYPSMIATRIAMLRPCRISMVGLQLSRTFRLAAAADWVSSLMLLTSQAEVLLPVRSEGAGST